MKLKPRSVMAILWMLSASAAASDNVGASVLFKISKGADIRYLTAALRRDFPGMIVEPVVGDVYLAKDKDSRGGARDLAGAVGAFNMVQRVQPAELGYPPRLDAAADEPDKKWFLSKI